MPGEGLNPRDRDRALSSIPAGWRIVEHGDSQAGDKKWCGAHGWEKVNDYPCTVLGYWYLIRRSPCILTPES